MIRHEAETEVKSIFPTIEGSVLEWGGTAGQHYRQVLYKHERDLNLANSAVRQEAMQRFAPNPDRGIYNRGVRRRMAPMLAGNQDWFAAVHAIFLSVPRYPYCSMARKSAWVTTCR